MPEQYIYSQGPELTILIPHYKTLELSKLCLRSIKLFTDLDKVKVIVIDNDSNDQSLEYLRSINWIKLIERKDIADESPAKMHAKALDLGMEHVKTKYVLSIHTDTIVATMILNPEIAGKRTGKPKAYKRIMKELKSVGYDRIIKNNDLD